MTCAKVPPANQHCLLAKATAQTDWELLILTMLMQDQTPTLWFAEDGARIGRFVGHKGAVNTCDWTCTPNSVY